MTVTTRPALKGLLVVAATAAFGTSAFAAPSTSVNFYNLGGFSLVGTSPTGALGSAASLAYDGSTLYLGQGTGTATNANPFVGVADAFGANTIGPRFGSAVSGGGVTNLDIANGVLLGLSTGANASDTLQVFNVGGAPTAAFAAVTPSALGQGRFDAAALDPGNVNGVGGGTPGAGAAAAVLTRGSGLLRHIDTSTGATGAAPAVFNGDGGTGYRGLDFDSTTGDVYIRSENGVTVGIRSGDNSYNKLNGVAGTQQVVADPSGAVVGLNVAYLGGFGGNSDDALVLYNDRSDVTTASSFAALNLAQRDGSAVATNFLTADGSAAFGETLQTASQSGIFDFSYDAASGNLAVLDTANSFVYLFSGQAVPEPATAAVLALGGLALLGRRRTA